MDLNSQVHGYTTGVIFESEFTPSNDFKVSSYENGEIKSVNLPNGDKTFLSAAHYNSNGSVSRLVYKDVKSVAARAFNLETTRKFIERLYGWLGRYNCGCQCCEEGGSRYVFSKWIRKRV